uniref:Uncharacterized protein n=1 Tax=Theropithecus gelada TaxID=9565 RepID=A0A8D2ELX8_THEGE
ITGAGLSLWGAGPLAFLRLANPSLELGKPRSEVKAPSGLSGLHARSSPAPSESVEPQAWVRVERDAALARDCPGAPKTREQSPGEKPLNAMMWSRLSATSASRVQAILLPQPPE